MAVALRDLRSLLRYGCLPHIQLGRAGTLETLSTSTTGRGQHTLAERKEQRSSSPKTKLSEEAATTTASEDDEAPPPLRFVSTEHRTPRAPPARRIPICFPTMQLQLMRLSKEDLQQVKETGWLREAVFKTTPNVTKLEIAAFLESVYGMSVERVHTINYLGRRHLTVSNKGKREHWREDDWKKAYVNFRPPPGLEHLAQPGPPSDERPVIERVREAARAPRPAPKRLPWKRAPWVDADTKTPEEENDER